MKSIYFIISIFVMGFYSYAQDLNKIKISKNTGIFLNGKYYNNKSNDSIKLQVFKPLYEKEGFRIVLEDIPLSAAYFLQRYYETENKILFEETLQRSNLSIEIFEWGYFNPDIWLDFYKSLPSDDKFIIRGIGIEYPQWLTVLALHDIVSKYEIPKELEIIKEQIDLLYEKVPRKGEKIIIKNPYHVGYYDLVKPFSIIKRVIDNNEKLCRELLQNDYYYFSRIIESVITYASNLNTGMMGKQKIQDSVLTGILFSHILEISKEMPNKKVFGQIGICHASKYYCDECLSQEKNLATYLNDSIYSPYFGKVNNAIIYYKNIKKLKKIGWTKEQRNFLDSLKTKNGMFIYKIEPNDILFSNKQQQFDFIIINDF